jgi:hypothetical protein
MRFAGIAAHEQQYELQQTYIAFAEKMLLRQTIPVNIVHLRRVYTNYHQAVHALNQKQPAQAGRYFIESFRIRPDRAPGFGVSFNWSSDSPTVLWPVFFAVPSLIMPHERDAPILKNFCRHALL